MDSAISLYGYLVLAFLGVIVPLLGILLSLFRQGLLELSVQAKREIKSSNENLREQLEEQSETGQPDVQEIEKSIRELKHTKRRAERRLRYLDPKRQLLKLSAIALLKSIPSNPDPEIGPLFLNILLVKRYFQALDLRQGSLGHPRPPCRASRGIGIARYIYENPSIAIFSLIVGHDQGAALIYQNSCSMGGSFFRDEIPSRFLSLYLDRFKGGRSMVHI